MVNIEGSLSEAMVGPLKIGLFVRVIRICAWLAGFETGYTEQ